MTSFSASLASVAQRDGLALLDQADGACFFLEGNDCRIQPVKPQQCRDFPNQWNFPGWRERCEATPVLTRRKVSRGLSHDTRPVERSA